MVVSIFKRIKSGVKDLEEQNEWKIGRNRNFFFVKIGYKDWQSPYIYADFKRKYFKKLYLHPNKAGKDSEELFKEITEAAKKVQGKDSEELFEEIT